MDIRESVSDVGQLDYQVVDGVAVISLGGGGKEVTRWGTKQKEHHFSQDWSSL